MKNTAYVLSSGSRCIYGIYTEALDAVEAFLALSIGCVIQSVEPGLVSTKYTVLDPEDGNVNVYYIERSTLNEYFWRK